MVYWIFNFQKKKKKKKEANRRRGGEEAFENRQKWVF